MAEELSLVVLRHDLPQHGLAAGDVGTVVASYGDGGYEVEFLTADGDTVAVITLADGDVRAMDEHEILHVREVKRAASA